MRPEIQSIDLSEWTDSLSLLSDNDFFEIIHLYLGEVKAPYNKQKLLSAMTAFIKNPSHIESIKKFISLEDLKILTAIKFIKYPTKELLSQFFASQIPIVDLYNALHSLSQRLLIFSVKNEITNYDYYKVNPVIECELEEKLNAQLLFPERIVENYLIEKNFELSPLFLAAFYSEVSKHHLSCKADGSIKKNDMLRLKVFFPDADETTLQLLANAFFSLSLLIERENKLLPNENKIRKFATQDETAQAMLLCAAATSLFSQEGVRMKAQLLYDCLEIMGEKVFSEEDIIQLACIMQTLKKGSKNKSQGFHKNTGLSKNKNSRFSQMMENAFFEQSEMISSNNAALMEKNFQIAQKFGIIKKIGKDSKGNFLYKRNQSLHFSENDETINEAIKKSKVKKFVNVDSIFSVTIMSGLSFSELLEFSNFLKLKKYDLVAEFEITKKSVANYFDQGKKPEDIISVLEKFSEHKLSESLKITLQDWYEVYTSTEIYKGYVLKVSSQNAKIIENNDYVKKYLKEKISEGIYLLDIPNEKEFAYFKKTCAIDILASVKESKETANDEDFPVIQKNSQLYDLQKNSINLENFYSEKIALEAENELLKKLEKLNFTKAAKESLSKSIKNHLIICEEQLSTNAVRTEILEASGMDFAGKLRLLEMAEKNHIYAEITIPNFFINDNFENSSKTSYSIILAKVLSLTKQEGDAVAKIQSEEEKETKNILASKITHIKLLKGF